MPKILEEFRLCEGALCQYAEFYLGRIVFMPRYFQIIRLPCERFERGEGKKRGGFRMILINV